MERWKGTVPTNIPWCAGGGATRAGLGFGRGGVGFGAPRVGGGGG